MLAGIVPAGGAGRRMGGVDKALLRVGGMTLLDRVLGAARPVCDRLVVVGPTRPTNVPGVAFVIEPETGGGPVPAVTAGLAAFDECDVVLILAADLPLLTDAHLRRLVTALAGSEAGAAAAATPDGPPNPLLAAYRAPALRAAVADLGRGAPASRMLPTAVVLVDLGTAALNVNRPADLAAAEALLDAGDG
ncbi:MAG: nucleotidyltransferase family protein [Actinomycetota bacterium]|nr:nucleotidyltransferase family protein [Actinomycetota bacterium]